MVNQFVVPKQIITGAGALKESVSKMAALGKKALIVTGKSMIRQGKAEELKVLLNSYGTDAVFYSEVTMEPTDSIIEEGLSITMKPSKCSG